MFHSIFESEISMILFIITKAALHSECGLRALCVYIFILSEGIRSICYRNRRA